MKVWIVQNGHHGSKAFSREPTLEDIEDFFGENFRIYKGRDWMPLNERYIYIRQSAYDSFWNNWHFVSIEEVEVEG